ncbi:MAG: putative rane protein [Rickettsiales bacterium]|jgi:uncharacterized membrane protein|nr:putative rane protein [Rickettsiales bacterium]
MNKSLYIATAAALISLAATAQNAQSEGTKQEMEKCYGISKAQKNDCSNSRHSCAGAAEENGMGDEWVFVPKGLCERLNDGSLTPKVDTE